MVLVVVMVKAIAASEAVVVEEVVLVVVEVIEAIMPRHYTPSQRNAGGTPWHLRA